MAHPQQLQSMALAVLLQHPKPGSYCRHLAAVTRDVGQQPPDQHDNLVTRADKQDRLQAPTPDDINRTSPCYTRPQVPVLPQQSQ